MAAKRLARSDLLTDREGWAAAVVSVTERKGRFPVYNLEVAGAGTYYAGEAGWWVHNACLVDEQHHILPRQHEKWFNDHGIADIDDYVYDLPPDFHHIVHRGRGGGWWNDEWADWMNNHPDAGPKEIWEKAHEMMDLFGMDPNDIHRYTRR